jgi:branched-chain amino acid transport system ATP-binding protein
MSLLTVENISKDFGGLKAIKNVQFHVNKNEIVGLIGPNGAGKTTLFNLISGVYFPNKGKIIFEGKNITKYKPYQRCKLGIGRTFQLAVSFKNMTVIENITTAILFRGKEEISDIRDAKKEALKYCDLIGLKGQINKQGSELTLLERKRLELARALAIKPKIILLDEIMAGLRPGEVDNYIYLIKEIQQQFSLTIIIVEHIMRAIMAIADNIIVLHHGEKIAEGKPKEIAKNPKVIDAYLGEAI